MVVVAALAGAPRAGADAPNRQGWWSASGPAAAVTAADVPPDGLLVQGGATTPSAFAALAFALPTGSTPGTLTLKLAPNAGTTPGATIRVCRLTATFAPAQGGALSDAPTYDCAHPITGAVGTDHVTVDVSSLASADGLTVALLAAAPTDRIVFAATDAGALEVHEAPAATADATPVPLDSTASPEASLPGMPAFLATVPPVLPEATLTGPAPTEPTSPTATGAAAAAPLPATTSPGAPVLAATLAILGVALAIALWLSAGRLAGA